MELQEDVRRINGVEVHFPYKPYPSQISMMAKIISGVKNRQNCLLESPTGSGKSLALLCSALAWQAAQHELANKEDLERSEIENGVCTCSYGGGDMSGTANQTLPVVSPHFLVHPVPDTTNIFTSREAASTKDQQDTPARMISLLAAQNKANLNNEDDDFQDSHKKFRTPGPNQSVSYVPHVKIAYETQPKPVTVKFLSKVVNGQLQEETKSIIFLPHLPGQGPSVAQTVNQGQATPSVNQTRPPVSLATPSTVAPHSVNTESGALCPNCKAKENYTPPPKRKVPKIYFGTRTHKQIAQIVRELRKTYYRDVKMTILASREHTCIHPTVSNSSSKSEGCKDLLDGPGCNFNTNTRKLSSQSVLKNLYGNDTAWDIEDLVTLCSGKKVRACPYYVSRGLRVESDIVFCPYNYLVDPIIRKTMEINLKEEIIILDEGHNIEDSARESVSKSIEHDSLTKIIKELGELVKNEVKPYEHHVLLNMCSRLDDFIKDNGSQLEQQNFEQASTVWAGMDIVARLVSVGLGPKDFPELTRVLSAVTEEQESEKQRDGGMRPPRLSVVSANVLEALFTMLDFLYREELRFVQDYRVAIVRSMGYSQVMNDTSDQWLSSRKKGRKQMRQVFTLNFWCLNPAVAFSDFTVVRNLVLTSGTLSPMSSFSSELGMSFPISLEANHVIKDSQVWVGSIGEGPGGGKLQATYKNTETFEFQDELGRLVLEVCKTVPHGILCFLPSYKMLEKLSNRWQTTGLWGDILQRKKIISEPRRGDKADFDDLLKLFYNVINGDYEDSDLEEDEDEASSVDGALFLAVCRGKVSEGLDFADNNARAVITVGIPFPNFKDIQVELKRKYNDRYSSERGLLTGSDWYEIQAYRALNQALGRCIRHRNDWGALIMIDDRFVRQPQKYIKGLSKWVRNKACTFSTFKQAMGSLKNFTQVRLKAAQTDTSNISSLPTSQTDISTIETPNKLNDTSKTGELERGDNLYDLVTPSKPITSTPHSNQFKMEPPTSTPISSRSPPMSFPNKDIDSACKALIDLSTECAAQLVKKEPVSHKPANVDKSAKNGINKFFKFVNISKQNCSSNDSNLSVDEDVTLADNVNSSDTKKKNSIVRYKDSIPVVKTDNASDSVRTMAVRTGKDNSSNNEKPVNNNAIIDNEECHKHCDKSNITNDEEFLMSTPNLFESDMSDPDENIQDEEKCQKQTPETKPVAKRPLFRMAAVKASKLMKSWVNSDEDDIDFKTDKKQDNCFSSEKPNCAIKVRKGSNDSSKDDSKESLNQNEEEHLKTRRHQRGRKRKDMGKVHRSNKRSKGVDFLDDCNVNNDTSKQMNKSLSCSKCDCVLVTCVEGEERRKRGPAFVQNFLGKRNSEFLFIRNGEMSQNLKPVSHVLEEKGGVSLNSCWCESDQCCVQYFSCHSCPDQSNPSTARVMLAGKQSSFTTGMMWLLGNTIT